MKKKDLILITNYYPYFKGEEYIENEIEIASNSFEKIYIIPTMLSSKMKITRQVPSNVEIIKLPLEYSTFGKVGMLLDGVGIKNILYPKKENKESLNFLQILYSEYFKLRVSSLYKEIIQDERIKSLKEERDILIYSYWMHVGASVASLLKKYFFNNEVKAICRGHRYDLYDYASPVKFIPDRSLVLQNLDYIFPCSDDGTEYLNSRFPNYGDKIETQRLGTNFYARSNCSKDGQFVLVSCSAIRKVKRLDKIIKVVSELYLLGIPVKWIHIGNGPEEKEIKDLAQALLPKSTYTFLGRKTNAEVLEIYKSISPSVFINLSDSEGVPVSIMESMSFGIPIVATDVGGTREIVENDKNGYLFGNEAPIKDIVFRLLKMYRLSDEEYSKLCEESYRIWKTKCNAQDLYKQFYSKVTSF